MLILTLTVQVLINFWAKVLRSKSRLGLIMFWSIHHATTEYIIFEEDYIEAWNQRGNVIVPLFFESQHHEMHIQKWPAWDDAVLLRVLKAHFRVFQRRKGVIGILSPKTLNHIVVVKVHPSL